eukprot:5119738-Amphidinium_carterae.1
MQVHVRGFGSVSEKHIHSTTRFNCWRPADRALSTLVEAYSPKEGCGYYHYEVGQVRCQAAEQEACAPIRNGHQYQRLTDVQPKQTRDMLSELG